MSVNPAFQKLLNKAYKYLGRRSYSVGEMKTYLERKCKQFPQYYDSTFIPQVIQKLLDLKYLDDKAFAQAWVSHRTAVKPKGEYGLRLELLQKGVDKEVIDDLFSINPLDEEALVRVFLQKKLTKSGASDPKAAEKIIQSALRRGFKNTTTRKAFADLIEKK